jgi:hypothetical protein
MQCNARTGQTKAAPTNDDEGGGHAGAQRLHGRGHPLLTLLAALQQRVAGVKVDAPASLHNLLSGLDCGTTTNNVIIAPYYIIALAEQCLVTQYDVQNA